MPADVHSAAPLTLYPVTRIVRASDSDLSCCHNTYTCAVRPVSGSATAPTGPNPL